MITHVAISTGWTIDHVGWNLDLPRLRSLNKYWRKYPPIHCLFASYVGYKEPEKPINLDEPGNVVKDQESALAEFFAAIPQRTHQPPVIKNGDGTEP